MYLTDRRQLRLWQYIDAFPANYFNLKVRLKFRRCTNCKCLKLKKKKTKKQKQKDNERIKCLLKRNNIRASMYAKDNCYVIWYVSTCFQHNLMPNASKFHSCYRILVVLNISLYIHIQVLRILNRIQYGSVVVETAYSLVLQGNW